MPRRALLIVNENSRQGKAAATTADTLLRRAGIGVLREQSQGPAELDALIRRHAGDLDCVVLGGGDGTFNSAARALIDTGLPLGLLPLGTGNDLARTLNIPTDLADAVATIVAGKTHQIDVGAVNEHPFFNVASFGLSVRL